MTPSYPLQAAGEVNQVNKKIFARSRQYLPEHETDWDQSVHLLTYTYNAQGHQ